MHPQITRELVGSPIELTIAQSRIDSLHCDRLWCAAGMRFETMVNAITPAQRARLGAIVIKLGVRNL
jgi:hypothetical protein